MDSLERAIRLAFEKGDPGDVDFRKRVYRSAVNAVEKSAATNPNLTAEAAVVRMNRLKDVIRSVESEFHPAQGPAPEASSVRAEPTLDDVAPRAGDRQDRVGLATLWLIEGVTLSDLMAFSDRNLNDLASVVTGFSIAYPVGHGPLIGCATRETVPK